MEDWPGGEKTGARVKWTVVGRERSLGALPLGELPRIGSGSSRPCLDTLHEVVSGQTSPSAPAVHPASGSQALSRSQVLCCGFYQQVPHLCF